MENKVVSSQTFPTAMAFYHEDGFVPAFKQASRFAGKDGRIATLPDIIEARLNSKPGTAAWEKYFTTMSAEYFGYSKGGNRILIIAHGVGPMSTMGGVVDTYRFQFEDESRNRRGGRILRKEFRDLEEGKYGEVSIVDFEPYYRSHRYAFMAHLRVSTAKLDPLVKARLGPKAEEYIEYHCRIAAEYHKTNGHGIVADPYITEMAGDSNCWYGLNEDLNDPSSPIRCPFLDDPGLPLAHLLSIGQLVNMSGNNGNQRFPALHSEVACHAWNDGTRFLAVCDKEPIKAIHIGIEPRALLAKHGEKLMVPTGQTEQVGGFYTLMKFAGRWFTMYPKVGERMDTHEPEFLVTKMKPAGRRVPHKFETTVGGYHGFFKYGTKEVEAIAPRGANAYLLPGEIKIRSHKGNPTHHRTPVEFYRIEIDPTKRLMRAKDVLNNYELAMSLVHNEAA